jgi:hypothetical protein
MIPAHRRQRIVFAVVLVGLFAPLAALGLPSPASADSPTVSIQVASSSNPSSFGQDVTYTATLTTSDSGPLDPAEGLQFQDNGNTINNCNSQILTQTGPLGTYAATCDEPANSLNVGNHTITANYFGDSTYPSDSGSLPTQTVDPADTMTTINSPAPGTSIGYGNESQLSFEVTVSGPPTANQTPTNGVDLYDGTPGPDTYLCTAFVGGGGAGQSSGNCNINDTTLDTGVYSITAVYEGDDNFNGSTSASQDLTVEQVETHLSAFPVPGYALYGAENGNFFIVGAGGNNNNGNPTGSVSITADGVNLVAPGSCPTNQGGGNPCYIDSATALPASATPYQVTLSYPGDINFTPATTTVPLSVFAATSSTVLSVSPASATYGDESSVSLSATVTSGTTGSPTGSVTVQDGGTAICTITLQPTGPNAAGGSCPSLRATALPPGTYGLTADYEGDGNYQSSVSSARSLSIANDSNQGYWEVASDGGIFSFGTAHFYGSTGGMSLNAPIVAMAATPDGAGYWLVARDGGVFAYGDARYYGSTGGISLNAPIVGIAATPDGGGYWLVARDGGVFAFGDAQFYGSMGGLPLNAPIVGMAADPATGGYWEVASDGGIFAFGSPFLGSAGGLHLASPIVGMAAAGDGGGYWEVASNGSVFAEGNAPLVGSMGGQVLHSPIEGIAGAPDGAGYRMVGSDGGVFAFGSAEFEGSMGGTPLTSPVVGIASST